MPTNVDFSFLFFLTTLRSVLHVDVADLHAAELALGVPAWHKPDGQCCDDGVACTCDTCVFCGSAQC